MKHLENTYGRWRVSTVKLRNAIHEFDAMFGKYDQSKPYETMVFDNDAPGMDRWKEQDVARYATEAEAIAGHKAMCDKWRKR